MFVSVIAALVFLIVAGITGFQWIKAKEQLAANYWSQAVSAKKGGDRLRAAHFFGKVGKELGTVLTYVSFTTKFGIREQKAFSKRAADPDVEQGWDGAATANLYKVLKQLWGVGNK